MMEIDISRAALARAGHYDFYKALEMREDALTFDLRQNPNVYRDALEHLPGQAAARALFDFYRDAVPMDEEPTAYTEAEAIEISAGDTCL